MTLQRLDGPRLPPLTGGAAKQLVVLLHGYATDGEDIIALGHQWQRMLPDAAFVAPTAPEFCEAPPTGYQWFDVTSSDQRDHWRGLEAVAPTVDAFIDAELDTYGLNGSALALAGFSQGAIVALHIGLRRDPAPSAIVSFAGTLLGTGNGSGITARPPVLLIHGDSDDIIPVAALSHAEAVLRAEDIEVRTFIAAGITHGIDGDGTWRGGGFLRDAFGLQAPGEFTIG